MKLNFFTFLGKKKKKRRCFEDFLSIHKIFLGFFALRETKATLLS